MSASTPSLAHIQAPSLSKLLEIIEGSRARNYPDLRLSDTDRELIALRMQGVLHTRQIADLRDELRRERMARVRAERQAQVPRGEPWKYPWLHSGG